MNLRFDFKTDDWPTSPLHFSEPLETICARSIDEVVPALEAVSQASSRGLWAAGYVAYEAAGAFDAAMETHAPGESPLIYFGIYHEPTFETDGEKPFQKDLGDWTPTIERLEYDASVQAIREAAGRGDLYQANYTFPLRGEIRDDACQMYRGLQVSSQCAYGALLEMDDLTVISLSPELFFQFTNHDRTIVTRPMKGTLPRGRWLEEDEQAAKALAESEKDRAENLMIVDLLRNDLGRIAVPGTVLASKLFNIERYPTVWQMTSTISAVARADVSLPQIFGALFPCGSVTGAPKIAAVYKIKELERVPRGVYCGAIGMVRPGGDALFNVGIRTITRDRRNDTASYGVGGGITWDSSADAEYDEALSKARVLHDVSTDFELFETLKLEDGEFFLLQRHVERILKSARYFRRPLTNSTVESALSICADSLPTGLWRIRLVADKSGNVRTESAPLVLVEGKRNFKIAKHQVSSRDRFLFHKTTERTQYERALQESGDVYDVLLTNVRGELTEFTRGNLVIYLGNGLLTPPLDCGLLAGTLRQKLLANRTIKERVITIKMLENADHIWFINSVQGWIDMELVKQ